MMVKKIGQLFCLMHLLQIITGYIACGQALSITDITDKFKRYIANNPWEEAFLHTDRSNYVTGEEIWLTAYLINRQTGKSSGISSITYVELLNSSNVPLAQKRIFTPGGFGQGDLLIPDTLSTGKYILRAYTSWMKNFFPVNCFITEINIFNPLKPASQMTMSTVKQDTVNYSSTRQMQNSRWDLSVNADEKNVSIDVTKTIVPGEDAENSCMIFIHTHGIIEYTGRLILNNGKASLLIGREKLSGGISHITLFSSAGVPVSEKFIYTKVNDIEPVEIHVPLKSGRREKITVEVNLLPSSDFSADSARLSIAVVPAAVSDTFADLADYLVFGSEFGIGHQLISGLTAERIDSVLCSKNSQWTDWNIILSDSMPARVYMAEKEGHTISGRLLRKENRAPVTDQVLYLSTPAKKATFQYSRTGDNGSFSFRVPLTTSISDIIIQPENPDSEISLEFDAPFTKDFRTHTFRMEEEGIKIPDYLYRLGANVQVGKIYSVKYSEVNNRLPHYQSETKRFYGRPDIELKMDDYIKLPVMQEVFFELLQGVTLRERKTGYEVTILDPVETRPYIKPPLLLVDGVIVHDASIIAGIDPEIVEQIDVVKERYIVGDYIIYGLVNIITRTGDFSRFTLPDYAVRLRFRSIDPANAFWSPEYSSEVKRSNRLPDFRNTLYWNGSLKNSGGRRCVAEFWSSDFAGEYEIIVQGMTPEGIPVSGRKRIIIN